MTPALRVVSPGLLTTIQDRGRTGYQHLGVPVSGALDMVALAAANALVNNRPEEAALEIFYRGPVLAVEAHSVRLAIVGGEAQIERLSDPAARNGQRVETMRSLTLRRGEAIRIGSISNGACCYLAIEGGLALCPVLGSLSTDIRSRIGGIEGRALAEGDLLAILSAGAYGMAMASNYNTRPRAAEVMVDGNHVHLIRRRETVAELFALESILPAR